MDLACQKQRFLKRGIQNSLSSSGASWDVCIIQNTPKSNHPFIPYDGTYWLSYLDSFGIFSHLKLNKFIFESRKYSLWDELRIISNYSGTIIIYCQNKVEREIHQYLSRRFYADEEFAYMVSHLWIILI